MIRHWHVGTEILLRFNTLTPAAIKYMSETIIPSCRHVSHVLQSCPRVDQSATWCVRELTGYPLGSYWLELAQTRIFVSS